MKNEFMISILLWCIVNPVSVIAGGDGEASEIDLTAEKSEYISQSDATKEDYNMMAEFSASYNECLGKTARTEVVNYHDPRHVVDVAMKKCAINLEELNVWLTEKRFPPSFKMAYIKRLSRKSVRQIMPEIMFMISTQQP